MRFLGFQRLKQKLLAKLIYSPFLRLVLFNFWFRLAFVCFAGLLIFLALFLPRIWRVTPPGFLPVITISGLDMAQAWSLKRSALRATSARNFELAADAWNTAIANNPAAREMALFIPEAIPTRFSGKISYQIYRLSPSSGHLHLWLATADSHRWTV